MDYVRVESSHIQAVAYDDSTMTLGIRFKDGGDYHYDGVPERVYAGLMSARSVGGYFDRHVKRGGYRCRKIQ